MSIHSNIKAIITQIWFCCSAVCKLETKRPKYLEISICLIGNVKKNVSLKLT